MSAEERFRASLLHVPSRQLFMAMILMAFYVFPPIYNRLNLATSTRQRGPIVDEEDTTTVQSIPREQMESVKDDTSSC